MGVEHTNKNASFDCCDVTASHDGGIHRGHGLVERNN